MDPDRPTPTDLVPLDDAALAALVRDVADEWIMPPQRLDVPIGPPAATSVAQTARAR